MPLALRFALRELRGGFAGFRILIACLALGVAAIAGVGSLGSALNEGLRDNGRALLGGDVEFRLTHRQATPEERAWLERTGRVSVVAAMRAMARVPANDRRTLIELKAVDDAYPLYGTLEASPSKTLGPDDALVDETLAARLDAQVGTTLRIGEANLVVRGIITNEPDRGADGLILGPRVMISHAALQATGLVQPGSLVRWSYHLALPSADATPAVVAEAKRLFPDAGWRILDPTNASPALSQWIGRIGAFLTLVGLTALLVGGVAVANAVRSHLDSKIATIATLKCLGAPGRTIVAVYGFQVAILALIGTAIGLAIGVAVPFVALPFLEERIPVGASGGFYPGALLMAVAYGALAAIVFALWPLGRARETSPASLFRDIVAPERQRPRGRYIAAIVVAAIMLAGLAIATTSEKVVAAWFVVGAIGAFLALGLAARGIAALARRAPRLRSPLLRLAIGALHRPGAATMSILLSLGLGLAVLATLAEIEANLSRVLTERLPENAPAFFFVDIQPDQLQAFTETVRGVPGTSALRTVPNLRGRITHVNGVPAERASVAADSQWAMRGDRGLTYAVDPPEGSTVVAGQWWPRDYKGPPLISFDAKVAEGLGLKVGDTLGINVLGRDVTATIANLRRIDWASLGINYAIVFAPGFLERAPHTVIATVRAEGAAEEAVFRAVTDRFPNVTAIRVKETLDTINETLGQIGLAIRIAGGVAVIAGILVLAGAIGADQRRRLKEAAVLKALGATRGNIVASHLAEYALLGGVAGVIAAVIGVVASYVVIVGVMKLDWQLAPVALVLTILGGAMVTIAVGLGATWTALSGRTAQILRAA